MSEENLEMLRRANAALNAHDIDAWLSFADPEIEYVDHSEMGESTSGLEALRRLVEGWLEALPGLRMDVEEYVDAADRVVVRELWTGTGTTSGLDYRQLFFSIYTLRAGKCVRVESGFPDWATALAAAGVTEKARPNA
jgi:ketosteroid isomerase-like protein